MTFIAVSTATRSSFVPRAALVYGVVALVSAGFLFFDVRTTPIVLWDESRIAVNALEMYLGGRPSLVATFGSQPDLWNTKPPLLIWLIDLSMTLFGPSEWSARLPSAIATMGTLALVLSFTKRVTGSFAVAVLAVGLLTLSILFFGDHGARTADYEALLGLFTTASLYVLFFALHRRDPGLVRPGVAAILLALAVLTKGIAGLIPGVGLVVYLVLVGRWRRPFGTLWYAGFGALAMSAGPIAFFVLRERAAPGYLHAALFNDLYGRFGQAIDLHSGPPWFYVEGALKNQGFSGGLFAMLAPIALIRARGRARLGLLYSSCVAVAIITVVSLGATKLIHYAATALPFMAIATAIALHEVFKTLNHSHGQRRVLSLSSIAYLVAVVALLAPSFVRSVSARTSWIPSRQFGPQALYGELFRDLSRQGLMAPHVMDHGIFGPSELHGDAVPPDYAPQLHFYRLLANSQGMRVVRIAPATFDREPAGTVLASCDPLYTPILQTRKPNLTSVDGCVAVRHTLSLPTGPKPRQNAL